MARLAVERLTKRYGTHLAVDDLTFSIGSGVIAGFLGPNGAGKTTTFRMLVGLASPTSGRAEIDGQTYGELADPGHRVGAMLEISGYHPTRSARDHLRTLAHVIDVDATRVDELLELVELTDAAGRAVGGFSSGMRQRLGLAAALLGDPDVLLLDEPANGLDPKGIRWLRGFLRGLAHDHGKTVFVSSHVLAEMAEMVDEVVIIDRGRLVAHASIDEVVAHAGRRVVVRSPDVGILEDRLLATAAQVTHGESNRLVISGLEIEEVGRIAAAGGCVLHELREEGQSLEDTFLALTAVERQ
ncbi:MAG TPA: ATP-binding cassette domain-containing protein [Acidimicrobiia bacterium]|nr:ATP-binding cassette domain-containing protein [Acidimicrobiia bacterium]